LSPSPPNRRPARPAATSSRKPAAASGSSASSRRLPIAAIVGVALAIALVVVIVLTMGGSSPLEVGAPTVSGESLPAFDTVQNDTALGLTIPEASGADFDGTPVAIPRDGRIKVLMFFAHWCGVCQQEVPLIAAWLSDPGTTLPEGVDLISVSTGVNRNANNYPSSQWLAREGWTVPLILDSADNRVANAFGLSAYPYFVFVDAEGRVVLRITGALSVETIESVIAGLVGA